ECRIDRTKQPSRLLVHRDEWRRDQQEHADQDAAGRQRHCGAGKLLDRHPFVELFERGGMHGFEAHGNLELRTAARISERRVRLSGRPKAASFSRAWATSPSSRAASKTDRASLCFRPRALARRLAACEAWGVTVSCAAPRPKATSSRRTRWRIRTARSSTRTIAACPLTCATA